MSQYVPDPDPTDAPHLLRDAVDQGSRLLRNELELAKREMSNKLTQALLGLAMIGLALVLVLIALDVLVATLVAAIAAMGAPVWVATLIVAGTALVAAAILFMVGKARLNPKNLAPERSMSHLRRDIQTIKETSNV